ncbi:MAG: flagellar basal body rod protein FlgC [Candidatus Saganbacteria bacterium]|nr:flagellar basal body rod protein FlgC [Candidatus Saganbacteria bacterium]
MGLNQALDISVSAIRAEGRHMEIISSNIANINTTRTLGGGPYRRRVVMFEEVLASASQKLSQGGVKAEQIVEDPSPLQKVYNPSHPDADSSGFVSMPNVSLSKEMVDMIYSSKLYEANITVYNATKQMMKETLQLQ